MKRNWNETKAISVLSKAGAEVSGKRIKIKDGVSGLSVCSAMDYLRNHCGYTVII